MKKIMIAFIIAQLPLLVHAKALDTSERAEAVQNTLASAVMSLPGVNSIAITGCNPKSGLKNIYKDFIHCIEIGAETSEAYTMLNSLYPAPTKINDVYIVITKNGRFEIQPRMSGGR